MGLLMLAKIAKCRNLGINSRESSSRLPATSAAWFDDPVTFPPGRARLATKPVLTGSPADANTIGMTDVACFAARTDAVPQVTITSTFSRTNSAAISARRSLRPSAHRYSIATVRPSIQPSSRNRSTRAATHWLAAEGVAAPRKPIVRYLPSCCALAAIGHAAAAPPSSVMNSRRRIIRLACRLEPEMVQLSFNLVPSQSEHLSPIRTSSAALLAGPRAYSPVESSAQSLRYAGTRPDRQRRRTSIHQIQHTRAIQSPPPAGA